MASDSFERFIDEVVAIRPAFVVLSGDIYDQADREVRSQLRFARGLARLRDEPESPIPVFVVHGNHDPILNDFRSSAELPDNVTVFAPGDVGIRLVDVEGIGSVAVAGVSFGSISEEQNLVRRVSESVTSAGLVDARIVIGVVHANVAGTSGHDPYAPCDTSDLTNSPIHYWALGHVHARQVEAMSRGESAEAPGRWWAYPGNLQGRSTKPAECGPKGMLVVPLLPGGVGRPRFVECDTVRFRRLEVDATELRDVGEVVEAVREQAVSARDECLGKPVLLAVDVVGRSEAHHGLLSQVAADSDGLLLQCRDALGAALGAGELLKVRSHTKPNIDRDRVLERNDLMADLLRRIDSLDPAVEGDDDDRDLVGWITDGLESSSNRKIPGYLAPESGWDNSVGPGGEPMAVELLRRAEQILIDEFLDSEAAS